MKSLSKLIQDRLQQKGVSKPVAGALCQTFVQQYVDYPVRVYLRNTYLTIICTDNQHIIDINSKKIDIIHHINKRLQDQGLQIHITSVICKRSAKLTQYGEDKNTI